MALGPIGPASQRADQDADGPAIGRPFGRNHRGTPERVPGGVAWLLRQRELDDGVPRPRLVRSEEARPLHLEEARSSRLGLRTVRSHWEQVPGARPPRRQYQE